MSTESLIAGNTPSTDAAQPAAAAPAPAPAPAAGAPAPVTPAAAPEQNAPAAKPTDAPADKPADGADPAAVEKPTAPEKYEFIAPEGSELNPEVMSEFEGVAKELGLTQEAAQKLVDAMGPRMAAVATAATAAKNEAMKAEWTQSARTDKEFGGEKLAENLAVAKKALDAFGTPELRTLLNDTGLGNHPEIIRAFFKAGQKISGSNFVAGGASGASSTSAAATLYPNQAKG